MLNSKTVARSYGLIADERHQDLTHIHGEGPSSVAAADLMSRNIEVHIRIEDAEEASDDLTYLETTLDRYPDARFRIHQRKAPHRSR